MSVIIATRMPDGRVLVAAESRFCAGDEYGKLGEKTSKLFQREDGLIFGGVGRCSDTQALRYDENFIPEKDLRDLDTGYIVNLHVYMINRLMDFHGFIGPSAGIGGGGSTRADDVFSESEFVIAYGDGAWLSKGDGCVRELDENDPYDFIAVGSGQPYCEPYLREHLKEAKTPEDTKRIVKEAIVNAGKSTWTIDDNVIMFATEPIYNIPVDIETAKAILNQVESATSEERTKVDAETKQVKSVKNRRPRRKNTKN